MPTTIMRSQLGIFNLGELSNVVVPSPLVDQVLKYTGTDWIASSQNVVSGASGIDFFLDDETLVPISAENTIEINSLSNIPVTTTEVVDSAVVNNATAVIEAYRYNQTLNRTQMNAGIWVPRTFASVSSTVSGASSVIANIYRVIYIEPDSTITTTGSGTTRTATAGGSTPITFLSSDASADITLCSYLETPKGLYKVVGYTSPSVVTIETPSAYVNETGVYIFFWRFGFSTTTGTLSSTSLSLYSSPFVEPVITLNLTDMIGAIYFARTARNSNTTISYSHNGSARYSNFTAPLVTLHDDLGGLFLAGSPEAGAWYGHVSWSTQSIYGQKTFTNFLTVSLIGTVKIDNEILRLYNLTSAADMIGTGATIAFYQQSHGGSGVELSASISSVTESEWTFGYPTSRLAKLQFNVVYFGTKRLIASMIHDGIILPSDKALMFGTDHLDNGTWQVIRSGNNIVWQRRESDTWVTKQTISA